MDRILDCIVLAYIRRRLARCKTRGDIADRFADDLVSLLAAELERRHALLAGIEGEERAARAAEVERERRAAALQDFQSFEPDRERLRLQ